MAVLGDSDQSKTLQAWQKIGERVICGELQKEKVRERAEYNEIQ